MPSRRLRVARRFCSSSSARQLGPDRRRHCGALGDPERAQQTRPLGLVALRGQRLRVFGGGLHDAPGDLDDVAHSAHGEHAAKHVVAARARRGIRRQSLRHADVALSVAGGLLGDREVDSRALRR